MRAVRAQCFELNHGLTRFPRDVCDISASMKYEFGSDEEDRVRRDVLGTLQPITAHSRTVRVAAQIPEHLEPIWAVPGPEVAPTVILSMPSGSGKTVFRWLFAMHFDCWAIVDDWHPHDGVVRGALHLTNAPLTDLEPIRSAA